MIKVRIRKGLNNMDYITRSERAKKRRFSQKSRETFNWWCTYLIKQGELDDLNTIENVLDNNFEICSHCGKTVEQGYSCPECKKTLHSTFIGKENRI